MNDVVSKIKCHFCKKEIQYKILKKWNKRYIIHSTDLGGMRVKANITYIFGLVQLYDHDVGILRKRDCHGSSRKFKKKIGEFSGHGKK